MMVEIYDRRRKEWLEVEGWPGLLMILLTNHPFRVTVREP